MIRLRINSMTRTFEHVYRSRNTPIESATTLLRAAMVAQSKEIAA
jgi:hypothetical protein